MKHNWKRRIVNSHGFLNSADYNEVIWPPPGTFGSPAPTFGTKFGTKFRLLARETYADQRPQADLLFERAGRECEPEALAKRGYTLPQLL